ncbi:transglycosylase domain-containing protein [Heyndrickxia sporothermodurans]|uniref:transglycosylase domain-containing protein n=1 Tax=Heyndrickxia sporothermodurans TaxID=46224 RepID=UPI002E1BEB65|nr:transglycosylase domain-containing protein [Heyndrickxia sporothermodurans]MED3698155.1 transglycosylase domain-containing protein [Heyndrickxia sporothermodurans]MED3779747.1 transglycosylase domain-containing protein [Heyndrickxia sporothermodurans]
METMTNPKIKKSKRFLRLSLFALLIVLTITIISIAGILIYAKILGPPPLSVPQSTLYYSNDGTLIGESSNGDKRYWVDLDDVAGDLIHATISIEDQNFYSHHGFDYKRIVGAVLADIKAMEKVQGASTISQQYARNLFLTLDKTWKRKISEAFYTLRLEMNYDKKEILEGYLNTINYGNKAYGIEAASQFYFGKKAKDLSLAESAMLAGIPKGPNIYSPIGHFDRAKLRQKIILQSMVQNGYITQKEADKAASKKLKIIGEHSYSQTQVAPYFQDTVKHLLKTKIGLDDRTIDLGGLRVYTTLNTEQQEIAEKVIDETISEDSKIQVGFTAMDPNTGFVSALVGGRKYEASQFNRAVQAIRQPGSTIKPLLYYAALEKGFTPTTMMKSEPTTFRFDDGRKDYTPHNFNSKYANDEITMAQALALSDNVFAVKTHLFLGEDVLVQTAKQFGIETKMSKVPSLALGTSGVRVIDMVNAYSLLANGGKQVEPVFITRVEDYQGKVIYQYEPPKKQVLDSKLAFIMDQMMTGMFDKKLNGYSSVTGSTIASQITRQYAGKSGSTDTDSWMIGFTPQLTAGIWTGYDQGNQITLNADKLYAKNIWVRFMEKSLEDQPIKTFKQPKGVIAVPIDPESGKIATDDCPVSRLTYFIEGTEPTDYCDKHINEENLWKHDKRHEKENKNWLKRLFKWF